MTNDQRIIGNGGLCSIKEGYVELDYFIRGEIGGPTDLMILMEMSLLNWAWHKLGARKSGGKMFSHNIMANLNHKLVGFNIVKKNNLYRKCFGDDIHFFTDSKKGEKVNYYQLEIELSKRNYKSLVDDYKKILTKPQIKVRSQ